MKASGVRLVSVSVHPNGVLYAVDMDGMLWVHDRYGGWRTVMGPTLDDREKAMRVGMVEKESKGGRMRPRTEAEVEAEIERLKERSAKRRAVEQVAQAMRWAIGTGEAPLSERLLPHVPIMLKDTTRR